MLPDQKSSRPYPPIPKSSSLRKQLASSATEACRALDPIERQTCQFLESERPNAKSVDEYQVS